MRFVFKPLITASISLCAALTVSACQDSGNTRSNGVQSGKVVSSGKAAIGGAYTLVNQDGETVTHENFVGQPQLIYFGFTYCPDICPTALIQMARVQAALGEKGANIQPIFISVDPERDTPESLKLYVTANGFPEGLIGLTGTSAQVEAVKTAYKIYAAKVEDAESAAGYTVDHSSIIYYMDAQGELADFFSHTASVEDMTARIQAHLGS